MSREVHVRFREGAGVRFPRATRLIRGFEREDDARRVVAVLDKRMGRFGLTLHPDKTRLLPFGRPPQGQQSGKGPATVDFLGFTCYWARSRKGRWGMCCKTRRASRRRAKEALYDWCRRHRHQPVKAQHAALSQRVEATSTPSASVATFAVCCGSSKRRSGRGTNGCAVAASARA
jgi:hypothetical protein